MSKLKSYIGIESLVVNTIIGINPEELDTPQDLLISLKIQTKFDAVSNTDKIIDTIDYDYLSKQIINWVSSSKATLLEFLISELKTKIIENYDVHYLWLKVEKPDAIKQAKSAYVILEYEK